MQKAFYEEQWFWYIILAIVVVLSLTKSHKIILKGVGNGNANVGGSNNTGNNPQV